MKKILSIAIVCMLGFCPAFAHASAVNLVDGAGVSLVGSFSGKNTSYLTDGYAKTGTRWSKDSVWWKGTDSSIEISLNGASKISSISIQADSNDQYQVDYWDSGSSSWKLAFTAEVTKTAEYDYVPGLHLRESEGQLDIITDKLRVTAVSGDDLYSVSEVQAHGAPTPVPAAVWLFASGLGGLVFLKRRFAL